MSSKRAKKQYPEDGRTLLGFFMTIFANAFVTMVLGIFMTFLTDFSGIDTAMGKVGYAAAFGTLFLLVTRIVDAIDDPLQGWIVDSGKERKFGKYRRFGIIGTVILGIGAVMLFAIPSAVKGNAVMLWLWALVGYLLLDMGGAMGSITGPMMQKSTNEPCIRAKIVSVLRIASVVASIPAIFFVSIVTAIGKDGNLGETASKTAVLFAVTACVITLLGILLLKEPYRGNQTDENKRAVNFKEMKLLVKNRPLWAHSVGFLVGNMSYGLSSAVMLYFIKWYFCADISTGSVDLGRFAALSGIYSLVTLIPNFLTPFLISAFLKLFKTVDRGMSGCMTIMAVGYGLIYVLNMTGIMKSAPVLLFVLYFLIMIPSGVAAMFSTLLTVECADYSEYTVGRNMTALINSLYGLTQKASTAVGAAIPGALLIAVGYSVNEATGAYAGDLASMPSMINGLSLILALIPAVMCVASVLVYKFCYKITPEFRAQMTEELNHRHAAQSAAQ